MFIDERYTWGVIAESHMVNMGRDDYPESDPEVVHCGQSVTGEDYRM